MRISQAYDLLAANTMTRPQTATDPKTATNGHPKTTPDTETAWDELNEPYTGPLYTWPCGHQNTIEWDDYQDEKGRYDGSREDQKAAAGEAGSGGRGENGNNGKKRNIKDNKGMKCRTRCDIV